VLGRGPATAAWALLGSCGAGQGAAGTSPPRQGGLGLCTHRTGRRITDSACRQKPACELTARLEPSTCGCRGTISAQQGWHRCDLLPFSNGIPSFYTRGNTAPTSIKISKHRCKSFAVLCRGCLPWDTEGLAWAHSQPDLLQAPRHAVPGQRLRPAPGSMRWRQPGPIQCSHKGITHFAR